MKNLSAVLALILLAGALTACAPGAKTEPPAPVSTPAPASVTATLPAVPLWGAAGLRLLDGKEDWSPGYAYAPFILEGATIQAVATPGGTLYLQQKGQEIYQIGRTSTRGGFTPVDPPQFVYKLPLQVGDQWQYAGATATYRIAAVESIKTPAGDKTAAQVRVTDDKDKLVRVEWWVPGYGLVRTQTDEKTPAWAAASESRETPKPAPMLGQLAPGLQALLCDDEKGWSVITTDARKELYRDDDGYWRSWKYWVRTPLGDLLGRETFPGSWGIYNYAVSRYDPAMGKFVDVPWISSLRNDTILAGSGAWSAGGTFGFKDFLGYPTRYYTYKFDGEAMRSYPVDERTEYAATAEKLLNRLLSPPPLFRDDIKSMFADPVGGEQAAELLSRYTGGLSAEPDPATPNAFFLTDGRPDGTKARIQTANLNGRWQITGFTWLAAPEPIGQTDMSFRDIYLGLTGPSEVMARLGPPAETAGDTRTYMNGQVRVTYGPGPSETFVQRVEITGAGMTPRGVGIGDTMEKVLSRYPKPVEQSPLSVTYAADAKAGSFFVGFDFKDGKVERINLWRSK